MAPERAFRLGPARRGGPAACTHEPFRSLEPREQTHDGDAERDHRGLHEQGSQAAVVLQLRDQVGRGQVDEAARRDRNQEHDALARSGIEELFAEAARDRAKASQLKAELDRHGLFKEYEDRFLDLWKRAE